jgi:hypothetical protein
MAPTRRKQEGLLARVNFPLYTLQMLTSRHVLVGGGGGSSSTGVANGFVSLSVMYIGRDMKIYFIVYRVCFYRQKAVCQHTDKPIL